LPRVILSALRKKTMKNLLLELAVMSTLAGTAFSECTGPRCIRIGAIVPASGKQKTQGYYLQSGYEMAIAEANAAGGVYLSELNETYMVDMETRDSTSSGDVGLAALRELISTYNPDSLLADYGASRSRIQVSRRYHGASFHHTKNEQMSKCWTGVHKF
jgi:ABC-type branched-subunit amino acid transport system substrate-binding protein